jgi:hypothetical protein
MDEVGHGDFLADLRGGAEPALVLERAVAVLDDAVGGLLVGEAGAAVGRRQLLFIAYRTEQALAHV